jgi:hypothetical protein
MARCPIVLPGVTRVTLADGEWLDLKVELNAGEYRDMITAQFKEQIAGEKPALDLQTFGLTTVLAYVVGWSFVDTDGKTPLGFSREILRKLDQGTFSEIRDACETHHEACEKAAAERKNAQAGGSGSAKTSLSAA